MFAKFQTPILQALRTTIGYPNPLGRNSIALARMASHSGKMEVTQRVINDHNDIETCYNKVKMLPDHDAEKWVNQLFWTIARHSAGEELVVYPLLEKTGPVGKELADKSRQDHLKTKEAIAEMEGKPISPMLRQKIDTMMAELMEHVRMEEEPGGDLDQLRKGLTAQELLDAGGKFERTKMFVPTHAHPNAPDKPPFATIVGLMTAPIDKLRDAFMKFPDEEEIKLALSG